MAAASQAMHRMPLDVTDACVAVSKPRLPAAGLGQRRGEQQSMAAPSQAVYCMPELSPKYT